MKKTVLLCFFILLSSISQAQLIRGVGLKIGATISDQEWDYIPTDLSPESRTGFNIGVFAEFLDIPFFSVVGELNYVQKGLTGLEAAIADNIPAGDIRLNYLNITALAKLRLNYILLSPYLVAGPKVDIELSKDAAAGIADDFKKERLGFRVGLGTEVNIPLITFLVEVLYDADFNELYENSNLSINSSSYDIRVGVMF